MSSVIWASTFLLTPLLFHNMLIGLKLGNTRWCPKIWGNMEGCCWFIPHNYRDNLAHHSGPAPIHALVSTESITQEKPNITVCKWRLWNAHTQTRTHTHSHTYSGVYAIIREPCNFPLGAETWHTQWEHVFQGLGPPRRKLTQFEILSETRMKGMRFSKW